MSAVVRAPQTLSAATILRPCPSRHCLRPSESVTAAALRRLLHRSQVEPSGRRLATLPQTPGSGDSRDQKGRQTAALSQPGEVHSKQTDRRTGGTCRPPPSPTAG